MGKRQGKSPVGALSLVHAGLSAITKTTVLAIALAFALALNLATLTVPAVFNGLSSIMESVGSLLISSPTAVRAKHSRQLNSLRGEAASLKTKNRQLRNQQLALEKKIKRANQVTFKGSQTTLRQATKHTTTQITQRTAKAAARNVASMAAEAIPFVGIAAIVTATAMELKDACDTMEDLHELEFAIDPDSADTSRRAKVCGKRVPSEDEIIDSITHAPMKAWETAQIWYEGTPGIPSLPTPNWDRLQRSIGKTVANIVDYWSEFFD